MNDIETFLTDVRQEEHAWHQRVLDMKGGDEDAEPSDYATYDEERFDHWERRSEMLGTATHHLQEMNAAIGWMAEIVLGIDTGEVFCNLTCGEAEAFADVLRTVGQLRAADWLITEHGHGDDDPDDMHHNHYRQGHRH